MQVRNSELSTNEVTRNTGNGMRIWNLRKMTMLKERQQQIDKILELLKDTNASLLLKP